MLGEMCGEQPLPSFASQMPPSPEPRLTGAGEGYGEVSHRQKMRSSVVRAPGKQSSGLAFPFRGRWPRRGRMRSSARTGRQALGRCPRGAEEVVLVAQLRGIELSCNKLLRNRQAAHRRPYDMASSARRYGFRLRGRSGDRPYGWAGGASPPLRYGKQCSPLRFSVARAIGRSPLRMGGRRIAAPTFSPAN